MEQGLMLLFYYIIPEFIFHCYKIISLEFIILKFDAGIKICCLTIYRGPLYNLLIPIHYNVYSTIGNSESSKLYSSLCIDKEFKLKKKKNNPDRY